MNLNDPESIEQFQIAYDNETPEDYEAPDRCPDCGQLRCVCGQLIEEGFL